MSPASLTLNPIRTLRFRSRLSSLDMRTIGERGDVQTDKLVGTCSEFLEGWIGPGLWRPDLL